MVSSGPPNLGEGPNAPRSDMVPNHRDLDYIQQYFEEAHQLDPVNQATSQEPQVEDINTTQQPGDVATKADAEPSHGDADSSSSSSDSDSSDDDSDDEDGEPLMSIEQTKKALLEKVDRDDRAREQTGIRQEINDALEEEDDDDDDVPMANDLESEAGFNKYYQKMKPEKFPAFPDITLEPTEEIELFAKFKNYSDDCIVLETAKEFVGPNGEQIFLEYDSVVCLEDRTILGRIDDVFGPVVNSLYSIRYDFAHYKQIKGLQIAPGTQVYRVKSMSVWKFVNQEMESQRKAEESARLRELDNPDAEDFADSDGEAVKDDPRAARAVNNNTLRGGQRESRGRGRGNRDRGGRGNRGGRGGLGEQPGRGRGRMNPYPPRQSSGSHGYVDPDQPRAATDDYSDGYNKLSRSNAPPTYSAPSYPQPPAANYAGQPPPGQPPAFGNYQYPPGPFGVMPFPNMPPADLQHMMQAMFRHQQQQNFTFQPPQNASTAYGAPPPPPPPSNANAGQWAQHGYGQAGSYGQGYSSGYGRGQTFPSPQNDQNDPNQQYRHGRQ